MDEVSASGWEDKADQRKDNRANDAEKLETWMTKNRMAEISRYTRKQIHFNTIGVNGKRRLGCREKMTDRWKQKESFFEKNKINCSNDDLNLWRRKEKREKTS